ncbi:MAG: S-layer homology domain-containing protein [Acidobacteriota bacterium]
MQKKATLAVLAILTMGVVAFAQELPTGTPGALIPGVEGGLESLTTRPPDMDTYGTSSFVAVNYATTDFTPLNDGEWSHFLSSTGWANRSGGSNTATCTGIRIPSGARWAGVTYWLYDTDAAQNITLEIYEIDLDPHTSTTLYTHVSSGSTGQQQAYSAFGTAETVDNDRHIYTACHFAPVTGSALRHAGLTVWYQLQVSPAPGTATFADVPVGAFGFQHVEALVASGITAGCGGSNFCPNDPLTRVQMAIFLAKGLGLHWHE